LFAPLGHWNDSADAPRTALLVQGAITLALVLFGAFLQGGTLMAGGVQTMVDYTVPVFWLFFLLTGVSLFVLRFRDPAAHRPFRVPLYPITPLIFCLTAAYMLWSGLNYAGKGTWLGLAVLAAGVPVLLLANRGRTTARPRGFDAVLPSRVEPVVGTEQS
jgi:basic amino acid/polyamine antiporter, APA family